MKDIRKMDKTLFFLITLYVIIGLVMILSASSVSTILRYHVATNHFFIRQLLVIIFSYFIGLFILFTPIKKYHLLAYFSAGAIIFVLWLVLSKGELIGNAKSWFDIGPVNLQPSEFAKTVIIVFMAMFYNDLLVMKQKKFYLYLIPMIVVSIMAYLIIKEPDFGSASILVTIAGLIFLTIPLVRKNFGKLFKLILIVAIILGGIIYFKSDSLFTSKRLSRLNFKNPCTRYQEESGYQVCNGLIAISSGGLFGVGLGQSTQKYMYLPESHTDFIFPIICEELGAIIGMLIIFGYGVILARIYRIAKLADNLQTSIIAYGAFWYFALHILINLLGVLALIPLTGVPLPFLSYGGSYTLNAILIIFLVERVAIENNKNKFKRQMAKLK